MTCEHENAETLVPALNGGLAARCLDCGAVATWTPAPSRYRVGDWDPTPDVGGDCGSVHPEGWYCTWPEGHGGDHVAGDGQRIVAVWSFGAISTSYGEVVFEDAEELAR